MSQLVVFRVDFIVDIKSKQLLSSNEKKMVLEAILEVNDSGENVLQKQSDSSIHHPYETQRGFFSPLFLGSEVITYFSRIITNWSL